MKNKAAQELGSIKTEKKTKASRENGKKGGRPKNILGGVAGFTKLKYKRPTGRL